MTDASTKNQTPWLQYLATTLVALLALTWVALLTHNSLQLEGGFTPDSVIYINAAENIAKGDGFSRSIVELFRLIDRHESIPIPVTQWAPLYPCAIALTGLAVDPRMGALLIAGLSLLPLLLVAGILLHRIAGTPAVLIGIALLASFAPLADAATHAWSETPALAFMFATLACLPFRPDDRPALRVLATAGLFAGLACATRFALLPLPVVCVMWIGWRKPMVPLVNVVAFALPCILIIAPVILRNLYLVGTIGGAPRGTGKGTIANGIDETVRALTASGPGVIGLSMVVLTIATLIAATGGKKVARSEKSFNFTPVLLLTASAAAYLAFLILAQARVRVDPIDTRLILPATLTIIVAAIAALPSVIRVSISIASSINPRPPRHSREFGNLTIPGSALTATLIFIMFILPQLSTARNINAVGALPPHDPTRTIHRIPVLAWLNENVTPEDLVIAEDALDYPFYLGPIHIAFFSQTHQPGRYLDYEETLDYLTRTDAFTRYTNIHLVIRPELSDDPENDLFRSDLIAEFMDPYPDITLTERLDDALIFNWREIPAP